MCENLQENYPFYRSRKKKSKGRERLLCIDNRDKIKLRLDVRRTSEDLTNNREQWRSLAHTHIIARSGWCQDVLKMKKKMKTIAVV